MRSPGEVVPGSREPDRGGLHRLPGSAVWMVTCARTQASWWRHSSLSVSCPSLGSTLIAAARARLWSSFKRRSESPLLAHQETKREEKVSCLFGSCRLFPPDSLPASCGALAPSGCVHAANPSPLPAIRPKPEPQLPAPPAPAGEQTSVSGW